MGLREGEPTSADSKGDNYKVDTSVNRKLDSPLLETAKSPQGSELTSTAPSKGYTASSPLPTVPTTSSHSDIGYSPSSNSETEAHAGEAIDHRAGLKRCTSSESTVVARGDSNVSLFSSDSDTPGLTPPVRTTASTQ